MYGRWPSDQGCLLCVYVCTYLGDIGEFLEGVRHCAGCDCAIAVKGIDYKKAIMKESRESKSVNGSGGWKKGEKLETGKLDRGGPRNAMRSPSRKQLASRVP